jgi:hypothetical protein
MLSSDGAVNNPANIRAGFAACGIYPLNPDRVLARLPPEETRRSVQTEFDQILLDELKKRRYGDPAKGSRAKKASRLPAGQAYTVGAPREGTSTNFFPFRYQYRYCTVQDGRVGTGTLQVDSKTFSPA